MTRRFIELWDINLGFGWAMATSVTTGLFGVFLLMVYGRLGKLNKLFKEKYQCCIPICDRICCYLEDKTQEKENEKGPKSQKTKPNIDQDNTNSNDYNAGSNGSIYSSGSCDDATLKRDNELNPHLSQLGMSDTKRDVLAEVIQIQEQDPTKETLIDSTV
eukprot:CAMPEP_0201582864 /NCGR_PEP_ID=MMETSP0190_2-20130828/91432_1 /ASSEMBLY_ACC=CAM_ASM_000263 /TAXON_ID=37353 /ORGANISM="Rosalina sp." /LENGTH=159 /DNA_ID=CAMNT_0048023667 /DNA_START=711 /DNA_END=1190 /DNA_ORIENTATION=+